MKPGFSPAQAGDRMYPLRENISATCFNPRFRPQLAAQNPYDSYKYRQEPWRPFARGPVLRSFIFWVGHQGARRALPPVHRPQKNRRTVTILHSQLPRILCFPISVGPNPTDDPSHLKLRRQAEDSGETIIRVLEVFADSPIWGSTHKKQPRRIPAAPSLLQDRPADPPSDI
jgi:hypothetical protein